MNKIALIQRPKSISRPALSSCRRFVLRSNLMFSGLIRTAAMLDKLVDRHTQGWGPSLDEPVHIPDTQHHRAQLTHHYPIATM